MVKIAIVTVYYPNVNNRYNIEKIAEQVDKVIICDNSPENNSKLFIGNKIDYNYFGENLGLSMAFNRVLKSNKGWNEDDYIIFFDQDSTITDNHVKILIQEYEALLDKEIDVGCLGPVYYNTSSGKIEIPKMKTNLFEKTYKVESIITSSMLITYKNLKMVGFWNEEIFLDMADWDLCWRLMSCGKLCCMTEKTILEHTLGAGEKRIGFLKLRVGSTIRDYYQTREALYLLNKKYVPLKYKCRFIQMLTLRAGLRLIFLEDRKKRCMYIRRGMEDYSKHMIGEYKQL